MEMFKKDSDYEWNPITSSSSLFERYTVMDCESAVGRKKPRALDDISPDVLVVNGWGHRESWVSLMWARKHDCDVVLLSDSVYENLPRTWWKEYFKRWLARG